MSDFPVDVTLDKSDICNLDTEQARLIELAQQGKRVVIYGRRNTGKTSLILNVVIPALQTRDQHTICVFCDLMGIESQLDIETRLRRSIERALARAFPARRFLQDLLEVAASLRPTIETDTLTGNISISLATRTQSKKGDLEDLIEQLGTIHKSKRVFIAFDEFQDIASVSGLAAIMRGALQKLPKDLPVFICGSKKHLLQSMFGPHKSPFSGWGTDMEIPTISNEEYQQKYYYYAKTRLARTKTRLEPQSFEYLIAQCDGIPESVNLVLDHISRKLTGKLIDPERMRGAIAAVVDERRGRFEEQMMRFRGNARLILVAIAKNGPIKRPKGKDFLMLIHTLAPTSVFNIIRELEQNADIYQTAEGYVVADPLLAIYLRRYH